MIEIGKWNDLKVIRSKDFGIYLGEEDSSTAETVLLPRKQVPEGVKAGASLRVFIYRDSQDRIIATTNVPLITVGEVKKLQVKNVTSLGAFMDCGLERDVLLPFKEQTDKRFVSNYKNGAWDDGVLTEDATVNLSECAGVLQYAQTCFEGLKAYTTEKGQIVIFRPDLNASRMADSCKRLEMPVYPEDKWVDAVVKTVEANIDWVPPYGSGATLYIRPYMFGSNPVIGVKPADEYQFRVFCTPVGPYFKGGAKPIVIRVSDYDRAAPHGTGHIKAGLNYAMSLYPIVDAHNQGFAENMYLDAATRTKVEETGGANFIFITKDGTLVTPKSDSILPSITRRSLMVVAEKYLGMKVEHREVYFDEVKDFAECGLCGTAAVISPVGKINDHGKEICFPSGMDEMGPYIKKLYDALTGIQMGRIEAPEGWIKVIK